MPDQNCRHYAEQSDLVEYVGDITPPTRNEPHALTVAQSSNLWITVTKVVGGRDSCVDIINSFNIKITAGAYCPRGRYVFCVRGSANEVHLKGRLKGHGSRTDVELGEVSDPAAALTKRVYLDLTTTDGSPVKVRAVKGWMPVVVNSDQPYEITVRNQGTLAMLLSLVRRLKFA